MMTWSNSIKMEKKTLWKNTGSIYATEVLIHSLHVVYFAFDRWHNKTCILHTSHRMEVLVVFLVLCWFTQVATQTLFALYITVSLTRYSLRSLVTSHSKQTKHCPKSMVQPNIYQVGSHFGEADGTPFSYLP